MNPSADDVLQGDPSDPCMGYTQPLPDCSSGRLGRGACKIVLNSSSKVGVVDWHEQHDDEPLTAGVSQSPQGGIFNGAGYPMHAWAAIRY